MRSLLLLIVFSVTTNIQANPNNNNALYQCGVRKRIGVQLIQQGWVAELGQWPWHVGLFHKDAINGTWHYKCGGTLIDQRHILTAAHCVCRKIKKNTVAMNASDIVVHLGQYDLEVITGVQIWNVEEVHVHKDFSTHRNDIAVLVLEKDVEYSDYVIPICLDRKVDDDISKLVGQRGSVAGWGWTENRTVSRILRTAKMPVVDRIVCVKADPALFGRFVDRGMFCAGERNGTSVCKGDSGSGMYISEGDRWILKGIVSFSGVDHSGGCDTSNYAGFTNVQYYLEWIRKLVSGKDATIASNVVKRRSEIECDKYREFTDKRLSGGCYNSRQPHSVGLDYGGYKICSGVLLSNKFVMTSCDCTNGKLPDNIKLADFFDIKALRVICHPKYEKFRYENDLALVELKTELPLAASIIPACLANNWTENLYDTLLLSGFQLKPTKSGDNFKEFVESVDNLVLTKEECIQQINGTNIKRVTDSQICINSPGHCGLRMTVTNKTMVTPFVAIGIGVALEIDWHVSEVPYEKGIVISLVRNVT